MKFLLSLTLLIAALTCAAPSFAWQDDVAAEREQTERRLQQLAAEIAARQAAIAERQQDLSLTQQQLRQLELQMSTVASELQQTQTAIAATEGRLQQLKTEQQQLEREYAQQQARLAQQIQAAYKMGEHDLLKLLLNQQQSNQVERMLGYYGYLNRARLQQLDQVNQTAADLDQVAQALTAEQATLQEQANTQRRQQGVLREQSQSQQELLKRLQREQQADTQRITALKRDQEALEQVLEGLLAALRDEPQLLGLKPLQGKMLWPAEGRVRRLFATERSGGVPWRGVIIEAAEGTPVKAIADGRVIFANWLRGYGLVLVLDHGEGYMSLYGHNQTIVPDVGQTVRQGETVALVGQSGGQTEPSLYFEIRIKGDAVNPTRWVR